MMRKMLQKLQIRPNSSFPRRRESRVWAPCGLLDARLRGHDVGSECRQPTTTALGLAMAATVLMCLTPTQTWAQAAGRTVVIQNVNIEDGAGRALPRSTVLFQQGRITSVGGRPLSSATVVNGTGKIITPGLIETMTQLGLMEVVLEQNTRDDVLESPVAMVPGFRATDGFNPASPRMAINRYGGVTNAVVSPRGNILSGTGYWFALTGKLDSRPQPDQPVAMFGSVGEDAAKKAGGARGGVWLRLRRALADARYYRKNKRRIERGQARDTILPPLHLAAMQPLLKGTIPLVLEAHRASDILSAVEFARELRIKLVIAGGTEAWKVASALARANVAVILRPSEQMPWRFERLAARNDAPLLLHKAGVRLIISAGGGGSQNIRRLRQEAGIAVSYGLPYREALKAITSTPAAVFGFGFDMGTVAVGKRANVVLWSGDPLEPLTLPEKIYINGVEQPMVDRQYELAMRYRPTTLANNNGNSTSDDGGGSLKIESIPAQ